MSEALVVEMINGDGEYTTDVEGYTLTISVKKA